MRSAARGNGAARRLLDASHRGVVGGAGVERQEGRGVVIFVEHPLDRPLSELNGLPESEFSSRAQKKKEMEQNSLEYNHLAEAHSALRKWCCGLNL